MMVKVFKLARQLGQSLLETDAFLAFQEAEIDALNDDNLRELVELIQVADDEEHLKELTRKLNQLPSYRNWQERREQFDRLVTLVLDQISYQVSATLRTDVPCGVHAPPPVDRIHEPHFQLADQLATELLNTTEYREYEQAEREFLTDENVLDLIAELRHKENKLRSFQYNSSAEGQALRREITRLREALSTRTTYRRYMEKREQFDRLLGMVLDTISLEITGSHRPDSGCGTTGSNCGCGSGLNLPPQKRIERTLAML